MQETEVINCTSQYRHMGQNYAYPLSFPLQCKNTVWADSNNLYGLSCEIVDSYLSTRERVQLYELTSRLTVHSISVFMFSSILVIVMALQVSDNVCHHNVHMNTEQNTGMTTVRHSKLSYKPTSASMLQGMSTTLPLCNFWQTFPGILSSNFTCYHRVKQSEPRNSEIVHCGKIFPYQLEAGYQGFQEVDITYL